MAKLPLVAIIGRPNTGKSTIFNALVRDRIAIESDVAGTTRDHITRKVELAELDYLLVDTGGMGGGTKDKDFEDDVHAQSLLALEAADLILFTVNAREELTKSDLEVADLLRKRKKRHIPIIIVANKCDSPKILEEALLAYHRLGVSEEILGLSAVHRVGVPELQESIVAHLKKLRFTKAAARKAAVMELEGSENPIPLPRIAIVGKPNVGKSSILNALMSPEQRAVSPKLVSEIAGTTRDATDTIIRHEEQDFIFVDTAGLRRPSRVQEDLEGLSVLRSLQAIEDCDVAILVLDGKDFVSQQDQRIAQKIIEAGKGIIIAVNKMDLMKGDAKTEKLAEVKVNFLFCRYAPVLPCSAETRDGILKLFALAMMTHRNRLRRIDTKQLRRFFEDAIMGKPMSALASAKHITQGKDPPPTFALFLKNPKQVQVSQLRYLENRMRETFGLEGTPIRWALKGPRAKRPDDDA